MFERKHVIAGVLTLVSAGLLASAFAVAEEEEGEEHERSAAGWYAMPHGVAPVKNEQYRSECGSCHTLYSPGLLPARSWQKIMGGLDNHFGDDASLAPDITAALEKYLVENASDRAAYRASARIQNSIKAGDTPTRITETRFFVAKHDEVPARMVKDNPKVKSFSNCSACHAKAEEGNFNEHDVRVPGFERSHF